jgi:hypothetical protein
MQELIGDLIRGLGYLTLKIITLGRYRSRGHAEVAEGAIGLAVIAGAMWLGYAISG